MEAYPTLAVDLPLKALRGRIAFRLFADLH
jgi:hypothetical protein